MDKDPNNIFLTDADEYQSPYDFQQRRTGAIVIVPGSQRPQCYIWTFLQGRPKPKKESRLSVTGKYQSIFAKDLTRCRIVARTLQTNVEESYYQWDFLFEGNEVEAYQNDGTVVLKLHVNPYITPTLGPEIFITTNYAKPLQFILHPNTVFDEITNTSQHNDYDKRINDNFSNLKNAQVILEHTVTNVTNNSTTIALMNENIKQLTNAISDLEDRLSNLETLVVNRGKQIDEHDIQLASVEKKVDNLNQFRHVVLSTNGDLTNISKHSDISGRSARYTRSSFLI